jgi:beta-xylosidase
VIEASTDLANWEPITTLVNAGGALEFVDPAARELKARFYRVKEAAP